MTNTTTISDKTLAYIIEKISCNISNDVIVVLSNNIEAQRLYEDLTFLSTRTIFLFPEWDTSLYESISPSQNILQQRIKVIYALSKLQTEKKIVITTTNSLIQKIPSLSEIKHYPIELKKGQKIQRDLLINKLINIGYNRESTTSAPQEFAIRGSVIDIQTSDTEGVRINFFDSELDSIKIFDPITQLSTQTLDSTEILPSSELILSLQNIECFKNFIISNLGSKTIDLDILTSFEKGIKPNGIEYFLPKFYKKLVSVIDLLRDPTIISLLPLQHQIQKQTQKIQTLFNLRKLEINEINKEKINLLLPPEQFLYNANHFKDSKQIDLISYNNTYNVSEITNISNEAKAQNKNVISYIVELFKNTISSNQNFIISCTSTGARSRLQKILEDYNAPTVIIDSWPLENFIPQICLIISPLQQSFSCKEYLLLTEYQIFNKNIKKVKKTSKNTSFRNRHNFYLDSLVVHKEHGLGQFKGLETIALSNSKHDCLKIIYKDDDKLFVPVENIDLLSKYSDENQNISLDKLGSHSWKIKKERVKKKIRQIAHHLLKIAAQRLVNKSEIIEANEVEYEKFCSTFPYVETEDQENTIQSVIEDLQNTTPMDRLICGDAGVGKTEIALRAAFITIKSKDSYTKRQVAFIAPTTLLSKQHFTSAQARFRKFNINIAQLSRFTPRKEINDIIKNLENGSLDMVIGTHTLLSKKVKFKNLSLVIIDEEQHFGVNQKEHLKTTKNDINILTLSATPIPRTLQMSLAGIKELSLIRTPPTNRKQTKVLISKFNLEKALEAILREFHRNGQSFFVCPRIKDLEHIEPLLREALPNLKIIVAHGGMSNIELEDKVSNFYEGKADLIIATSIVESGLDIPRANTIIIYKAEMFGLSQLYQLKGRVGRSNIDSTALFMVSPNAYNEQTLKRLSVLESAGMSGAGFMVSSHDMDIRGFGNLLGDEQSGNIKEIGIELYQKMLEETMSSIKQNISEQELEQQEEEKDIQINLGIPVLIPETYIPDFDLRMTLYQKLSSLDSDNKIEIFAAEMIDRFGDIPEEFENLISIIKLKNLCKKYHIRKIDSGPKALMVQFQNINITPEKILHFIQNSQYHIKLKPENKVIITGEVSKPKNIFKIINDLTKILD